MHRALAVLALVACSKPTPPAPAQDAAPAPMQPVSVASLPSAAPAPTSKQYEISFVHFEKDRLFECLDFSLNFDIPPDAGPDWKPKNDPVAELDKRVKPATRIAKTCAAQFPDRTVLASCTVKNAGDAGAMSLSTHFYNFADVGLDDRQMSECLKMKGDWDAVARTSPEWRKAKLEHDTGALRKAVGKMNDPPSDEP